MKKPICFAFGNLWRYNHSKNRAFLVDFLRQFDIQGIEITTGFPDEFQKLKFNSKQIKYLKSLDYVSMHAPFGLIKLMNQTKALDRMFKKVKKVYKKTNSQTMVVHASNVSLIDYLRQNYDFHLSIEHMEKKANIPLKKFASIVKRFPDEGICMDVSHNYTWSVKETEFMMHKFKDRISEVHFSGSYRGSTHEMLDKSAKNFFSSIQSLKKLSCPIVIEEDMKTRSKVKIKKEIDWVRELVT